MQKGKLLGVIVCLSMLLAGCTTKAPTSEESKQSEGSSEVSSSPISSSKPSSSSSSKASSSSAAPVDDMEVVSHEKGEGEVTETVKKRKNAEYYEITWQATDAAATATGFSDGKFSKLGDNVEYKVWSPVSMVARLYANATYNKDSIKGVSNTEDHTVWYDWRSKSAATPFKVKVEVNGEEYDQSAQTLVVKGKEVSLQDLNFPDLDYAGTNDEVLEMPWLDVQLNKGVNTIKLTRTAGYGHSYKTFSLRSDNDLHSWSIDDLKANRSEGDWGDKEWDDIGVKAFKVSVKQGTFSVSYTSPKAQKASLNVYIACKFSNSNQTPFWKKSGADKTEVTLNGVKIENGIEPDWTGCVESSLNDNGKLSYPIWFKIADVKLVEGENTFVFKYIDGGYSYHICAASLGKGKPAIVGEVEEEDGYRVNFKTEHCKVFVYEDQDYTVEPVEATSALTRDENGVICKYSPADPTNNVEEVKPQMNFKVVCDEGYEVDTTCFTLSGEEGKEWNNLKDISDGVFRITTIKDSIDVTIKAATAGTLKAGYTAEFVTEHCTVKVYTEKGFKAEDTATPYMSRNKTKADDGTYPYCKGENAQLSFEVIPEEGYEFVSGLNVGAEAESDVIEFIAPSGYNKIKRSAENRYNLTKVSRNLVITIKCTEKAEEPEPQVDGTLVKKTVAELKADNNWENEGVVTSFIIGEVVVTLQGSGGDSKYYDNGSNIRIYIAKKADGVDGTGSIKFEGRSLIKVMSVKVTYVWNKSVGTCDLVSGETTVVDAASKTFNITNPSEEKAEQLRITAIEVVYKAVNP